MKKGVILLSLLVLSLVFTCSLIFADEAEHVEKAYSCLEGKISKVGCNSLTLEQKIFSLLAVKECKNAIISEKDVNNCWPKTSCTVKSTAQAVFALDDAGVNTTPSKKWLLTQTTSPTNLQWFLEIDAGKPLPSTCTVEYKGLTYSFQINEDKKISANAGTCLTRVAPNYYWFQISPSCYNVEFHVKCDRNFLTTLLFKKTGSPTLHVLGDTHTSAPEGNLTEKVNALCFKSGSSCNYEASLWATFALWSQDPETSKKYLPYLIAMKEDNQRFLPESLLYFMTGKFKIDLLARQKLNSYWEGAYVDKFYDTALALWPFTYEEPVEKQYSKEWLLSPGIRGADGCWNSGNILDTAFILRSLWPEYAPECKSNSECVSPEICNTTIKKCYNPTTEPEPECSSDNDCESHDCGNDGYCVPAECSSDNDCESGVCKIDGTCFPAEPEPECGNGIMEIGEQCDKTDFNEKTCASVLTSAWAGTLNCTSSCIVDTVDCYQKTECEDDYGCSGSAVCSNEGFCIPRDYEPECGNYIKDDGEQCDGNKFGGQTCETVYGAGYAGTLKCYSTCILNTTGCYKITPPTGCDSDYDCEGDKICVNKICTNPNNTTPIGCTYNFQCYPQICENSICVDSPEVCTSDWDCTKVDEICEGGFCILPNITECNDDWDCIEAEEICENNTCIIPEYICVDDSDCYGTKTCIGGFCSEVFPECYDDWGCPPLQECVAGNCIDTSTLDYCVIDDDCTQGRTCIDGVCSDNEILDCESSDYFCMSSTDCDGSILSIYSDSCSSPFVCCSLPKPLESCGKQLGQICLSDEECVGVENEASDISYDESCCVGGGYCIKKSDNETDDEPICATYGGVCRGGICQDSEEESYYYCSFEDICCIEKTKTKAKGIILIFILLFLILLVVLGFIFRDKLKEYWIKMKSKFGKKKPFSRRPGMPMHPGPPGHPMPLGAQKKPSFFRRILPFKKPVSPASQQMQQRLSPEHQGQPPQPGQSQLNQRPGQPQQVASKAPFLGRIFGKPSEKPATTPQKLGETKKTELKKQGESKKPVSKSKKELDDVLKKLKEMGK